MVCCWSVDGVLMVSLSGVSLSQSTEDAEKKKGNSSSFRNYLNRDGPRALGSKDIPKVVKATLSKRHVSYTRHIIKL